MKRNACLWLAVGLLCSWSWLLEAQVSPVRLKVSKHQKSDTKGSYQTTDGYYRSADKMKSVYYTVELTNVSGGPARDFVVKWAVLVKSNSSWSYEYRDGEYRRISGTRVVDGEKTCSLEFGKSFSFDTDVVELQTWESVSGGFRRNEYGAKLVGYAVEVFCNDQRVASDIQPASVKGQIDQVRGTGDQKRHSF